MAQGSKATGKSSKSTPKRPSRTAATKKVTKSKLKGVKNKRGFKKQKTTTQVKQRLESALYGQIEEELQQKAAPEGRSFKVVKPKKTPTKKKGKATKTKKKKSK